MSVSVLKKYTVTERDIAMDDALKGYAFFTAAGSGIQPVGKEQLSVVFNNAPVIYGYLDVPFPLRVTSCIRNDDFSGAVQFDFLFEVSFLSGSELGKFISFHSTGKSWTNDELGKFVTEEMKNRLSVWLYARMGAIPVTELERFKADAFMIPEDREELGTLLPGFLKGTYKDLGVTLLASADPDPFGEKVRELMKWCAENGIKPDVAGAIVNTNPTLEIARGKLEKLLAAGKKDDWQKQAEELVQWACQKGIKREDAWEIINNAGTLGEARGILEEKSKGNVIVEQIRQLKEWAHSQGLSEADIDRALASSPTVEGARAILEDLIAYRRRLDMLLTRIVNECGLPRELALQKLGEAKGNLRTLEKIADEIFRTHSEALKFEGRFNFDSITDVYEEFDNCGGPGKAMRIREAAEKLRKIIPEYARKSMKECVAFTRKVSPEVVEQIIKDYLDKKRKRFWKIVSVLLCIIIFAAGIFFGVRSLKSTFVLEILTGNGAELESAVFTAFGKSFEYKNNSYRITALRSAKLKFIDLLKEKGHTVTTVSPEKYSVSLAAPADGGKENWKVDSSVFRSDAASLALFRRYFGSSINGGKADIAAITREELNKAQQELDSAGFTAAAADGVISITVKTYSCRISAAPETAAAVNEILRAFNITNPGNVVLSKASFNALLDAFARDSRLGKVEFVGNVFTVKAPVMSVYTVAVRLNSVAEYEKVGQLLKGVEGVKINSAKLINHADVVTIAEFKIGSMARSAAQLKESVCGALSGKLNNFRERDVKVK